MTLRDTDTTDGDDSRNAIPQESGDYIRTVDVLGRTMELDLYELAVELNACKRSESWLVCSLLPFVLLFMALAIGYDHFQRAGITDLPSRLFVLLLVLFIAVCFGIVLWRIVVMTRDRQKLTATLKNGNPSGVFSDDLAAAVLKEAGFSVSLFKTVSMSQFKTRRSTSALPVNENENNDANRDANDDETAREDNDSADSSLLRSSFPDDCVSRGHSSRMERKNEVESAYNTLAGFVRRFKRAVVWMWVFVACAHIFPVAVAAIIHPELSFLYFARLVEQCYPKQLALVLYLVFMLCSFYCGIRGLVAFYNMKSFVAAYKGRKYVGFSFVRQSERILNDLKNEIERLKQE